jgi:protein kinase-like protein
MGGRDEGEDDPGASDEMNDSVLEEMVAHLAPGAEVAAAAGAWQEVVAPEQRYEVGEVLGTGGMGEVHRAFDRSLGRAVALKFLLNDDAGRLARFRQEAAAQARVEHPNICRVYEVGELEGRPFIAMQLVEGKTLAAMGGELKRDEKVRVMRDVALAVQAAHEAGLIHRDLKPSNILVERDAQGACKPYVVDFGIAREARDAGQPGLTATGEVLGTPQYMAPEQALGRKEAVSERSDVYALGATLYSTLVGAPPFTGDSAHDVLFKVVRDEVVRPRQRDVTIPVALETIVLRCLSKAPEARYASVRALADDLDRYLMEEHLEAGRRGVLARLRKTARQHVVVTTVLMVALLAPVAGGGRDDAAVAPSAEDSTLFALSIGDAAPRPLGAHVEGAILNLAVAPDGGELALQVLHAGLDRIVVLSLEDGRQRILGDGGVPRYSVDGQQIFWGTPSPDRLVAFHRATGETRVVMPLSGRVITMVPGIDDLHLYVVIGAYKRRRDTEQWAVPFNRAPPRRVPPADGYAFHMPITRSGWQLAWRSRARDPILVPPGAVAGDPLDGIPAGIDAQGRIVYVNGREVRMRDLETGKGTVVNRLPAEHARRLLMACPSRDGRTLYYLLRDPKKLGHERAGR